ncbi:hypothetical protein [Mariprofundus ferrooxydans]|uniref:Uncharacterized protein n=1 Tax=Mariprofundus ferrooxydans PV-1 TaxID=314345 RepID=Q0F368_9PROT|nr:hypothetical protein [Mariprofundus ferrooxydans]EAU56073.1 hypothetical protein SPV1_04613 [Mariprofundus ferrooxydans PV-1]KON46653.1 hypothetical protein AL013_12140 [Mariprofundus ferrooxydans]
MTALQLAEVLENMLKTCHRRDIFRSQFYEHKRRFQTHGLEGLKDHFNADGFCSVITEIDLGFTPIHGSEYGSLPELAAKAVQPVSVGGKAFAMAVRAVKRYVMTRCLTRSTFGRKLRCASFAQHSLITMPR